MLYPIWTIPVEASVSVVVVSTHLAHRRQRSTSTEATGADSIPKFPEATESEDEEYELAEEVDDDLS